MTLPAPNSALSTVLDSPIGPLAVELDEQGRLVELRFDGGPVDPEPPSAVEPLRIQLEEYFAGRRETFELELAPAGTPFQRSVWSELVRIPYGETRSYGEIAAAVGRPGAARAVGRANGTNPIPVIIPCHRVVGSNGSLTGFGGGLERKRHLLELESGGRLPF